jgi:hypothetical protein
VKARLAFDRRRRTLVTRTGWLAVPALAVSGIAKAEPWPVKPVRLVVPVSAGGATDMLARIVADSLTRNLGQAFIVDPKPGAAGSIASLEVARAAADGYSLLVATSSTHAVAPAVSAKLRYDPVSDFTALALLAQSNNVLIASPALGLATSPSCSRWLVRSPAFSTTRQQRDRLVRPSPVRPTRPAGQYSADSRSLQGEGLVDRRSRSGAFIWPQMLCRRPFHTCCLGRHSRCHD